MEYPFKDLQPLDEATARTGYYSDWSHIDANAFHQISELVKFIREKGYGVDTREAIAQGLERVYHDALKSGNANMEVSMARKHFKDLASRLDASDSELFSTSSEVKGAKRGYSTLAESLQNLSADMLNPNLGKLTQIHMSDELLAQIAGNTAVNAVPADESLTTAKYADNSVEKHKTSFIKRGKNLFNKKTILDGFAADSTTGLPIENANYILSDYIPVMPGVHKLNVEVATIYSYRGDKSFASTLAMNPERPTYTVSPVVRYVRIGILKSRYHESVQFERGDTATPYENYYERLDKSISVTSDNLDPALLVRNKSSIDGKRILFIGDSNTHLNTYPNIIAQRTGAITYNGGFGGTRLMDISTTYPESNYHKINGCAIADAIVSGDWNTLISLTEAIDLAENQNTIPKYRSQLQNIMDACSDMNNLHAIVLTYGTNDGANATTSILGDPDSLDRSKWNGAINYFIKTISEAFPHVRIMFTSQVFRLNMPGTNVDGVWKHSDEHGVFPQMVEATRERTKENHVPFKDLYNESGINKYTAKHYLKNPNVDGTHYTPAGNELIGKVIEGFITSQ